jgi:hypothetical protein
MDVCDQKDTHPGRTRRNQRSYCFTPKHHGKGSSGDARWLPSLPRDEEFGVFDMADWHDLSDTSGNLYGLRIRNMAGRLEFLELGTQHEVIAQFWEESDQKHWHGYPSWPVKAKEPVNRSGQEYRPPRLVFDKMVEAGFLKPSQARRLKAGKHL